MVAESEGEHAEEMKHAATISTGTAARLMGTSDGTIIRLIHEGKIRATRTKALRGHWRIERASLCEYIETIRERYLGKKERDE